MILGKDRDKVYKNRDVGPMSTVIIAAYVIKQPLPIPR